MADVNRKSVINRGKRVLTLRPGPDGKPRVLAPGKSIECLDEKEFNSLVGYTDIADVDTVAPQIASRVADLEKRLAEEEAKNRKLQAIQKEAAERERQTEPEPAPPGPEPGPEPEPTALEPVKAPAPAAAKKPGRIPKAARKKGR